MTGALTACKTSAPPAAEVSAEPSSLGKPLSESGERSPFEKAARLVISGKNPEIGATCQLPVKCKAMKRYRVTLTSEERAHLTQLVSKGKAAARTLTHAHFLIRLTRVLVVRA